MATGNRSRGTHERQGRERSGGNSTVKDLLPSEKFGVLTRDEVEDLAGAVAALTDWVTFLAHLCERMNDSLCIAKGPKENPVANRPLSFYNEPHPNQVPMWDGIDEVK